MPGTLLSMISGKASIVLNGSHRRVLGEPPADLLPDALRQWHEVHRSMNNFHRTVRAKIGPTHADDVLAKAQAQFHQRLQRRGPVEENPIPYFYKICKHEVADHVKRITKLAEQFIGDNSAPLEDAVQRVHVPTNGLTIMEVADEASRALKVLEAEFSTLELKAWFLREMYGLDAATIADYTGTSAGAVRQTVRRARAKLKNPALQRKLRWTLASE